MMERIIPNLPQTMYTSQTKSRLCETFKTLDFIIKLTKPFSYASSFLCVFDILKILISQVVTWKPAYQIISQMSFNSSLNLNYFVRVIEDIQLADSSLRFFLEGFAF